MESSIKSVHYRLLFAILFITNIIFSFFYEYNGANSKKGLFAYILIGVALSGIFVIGIRKNESKIFERTNQIRWMYIGILISGAALILSVYFQIYHLWLVGCIIISAVYGVYLGAAAVVMFLCTFGTSNYFDVPQFLFYMLLGIIICSLASFFPEVNSIKKRMPSYIYSLVTGICCHVALFIITNNLNITLLNSYESSLMLIYTCLLITFMYVFMSYVIKPVGAYEGAVESTSASEEGDADTATGDGIDSGSGDGSDVEGVLVASAISESDASGKDAESGVSDNSNIVDTSDMSVANESYTSDASDVSHTSDSDYSNDASEIEEDHSLIEWFESENKDLYAYTSIIATIAGRAAKIIDADKERAYLGVLYANIGKLVDKKNYVEEGVKLVKEKNLPDYYVNAIESHLMKFAKPESKEAAIVYMTCMLISLQSVYKSKGKAVNMASVAEKILWNGIKDGSFVKTGLNAEEIQKLAEYYGSYFKAKD